MDGLAESINDQSKAWYDYFASSFEHLAGPIGAFKMLRSSKSDKERLN